MELIHVNGNTYYLKNNTNIGVIKVSDREVYLIDTGNDSSAGKKILKIMEEQDWLVKGIINTHSHADHIGGNAIIQNRTNCNIYTSNMEKCFTEYPILEPSLLYGSHPFRDIKNKFLEASSSKVQSLDELDNRFTIIPLKGHSLDMIGIKTKDDVIFLGDSLAGIDTINKYHVFYLYNVEEYLDTLDYLENLEGTYFILSHTELTNDLSSLIKANRDKIHEIIAYLYEVLERPLIFEEILKNIFTHFELRMDQNQYVLVGSTIKSYLTYLLNEDKIFYYFADNQMYWQQKKGRN